MRWIKRGKESGFTLGKKPGGGGGYNEKKIRREKYKKVRTETEKYSRIE